MTAPLSKSSLSMKGTVATIMADDTAPEIKPKIKTVRFMSPEPPGAHHARVA